MGTLSKMDLDKLRRKRDQEWEMAGCARHDHDKRDEKRHTNLARAYEREIARRLT